MGVMAGISGKALILPLRGQDELTTMVSGKGGLLSLRLVMMIGGTGFSIVRRISPLGGTSDCDF